MNPRIHSALDGELKPSDLENSEAQAAADAERLIGRVIRSIPSSPMPDLAPAVLRRIGGASTNAVATSSGWKSFANWVWSPRPLFTHWRPAYGMALVAAVIGFAMFRGTGPAAVPSTPQVLVQFRLDAPAARQVQLAGNFTDWKAEVTLERTASGVWTVVLPLRPGVHNYSFVIDGERWVTDPMAQAVADGFGGLNSQLAVLTPDESKSL